MLVWVGLTVCPPPLSPPILLLHLDEPLRTSLHRRMPSTLPFFDVHIIFDCTIAINYCPLFLFFFLFRFVLILTVPSRVHVRPVYAACYVVTTYGCGTYRESAPAHAHTRALTRARACVCTCIVHSWPAWTV